MTSIRRRRILLLQGPVGTFMTKLAKALDSAGAEVFKVNLCPGDDLFSHGLPVLHYVGSRVAWPKWLKRLIIARDIDEVILFGDKRPYHQDAMSVCSTLGIPVRVLEEGYIRPNYVTMDLNGSNAESSLIRPVETSPRTEPAPMAISAPSSSFTYPTMALWAFLYFAANALFKSRYPHYRHHKTSNPILEIGRWLLSLARKMYLPLRDLRVMSRIEAQGHPWYLVALQVHNDMQMLHHSDYPDVHDFIRETIYSFAEDARRNTVLLVKHHPMDRGHRHYGKFIQEVAKAAHCSDRVHYVHGTHLPSLIKRSLGCITVNSTVGLSALHHGRPVKVMGRAFYDQPDLTHQGSLASFWTEATSPDAKVYQALRRRILNETQVRGALYGPLSQCALRGILQRIMTEPQQQMVRTEADRGDADALRLSAHPCAATARGLARQRQAGLPTLS